MTLLRMRPPFFTPPRKWLWLFMLGASLLIHFLILVMPLQLSKGLQNNQENPQTILTVTFAKASRPAIPKIHSLTTPRVSYALSLPHPHKPANNELPKTDLIPQSAVKILSVEAPPDSKPKLDIAKIAGAVEHEVRDMENEQGANFIPQDSLAKQDNADRNLASLKEGRAGKKRSRPRETHYANGIIKYDTGFGSFCFKPRPDSLKANIGPNITPMTTCP